MIFNWKFDIGTMLYMASGYLSMTAILKWDVNIPNFIQLIVGLVFSVIGNVLLREWKKEDE